MLSFTDLSSLQSRYKLEEHFSWDSSGCLSQTGNVNSSFSHCHIKWTASFLDYCFEGSPPDIKSSLQSRSCAYVCKYISFSSRAMEVNS